MCDEFINKKIDKLQTEIIKLQYQIHQLKTDLEYQRSAIVQHFLPLYASWGRTRLYKQKYKLEKEKLLKEFDEKHKIVVVGNDIDSNSE